MLITFFGIPLFFIRGREETRKQNDARIQQMRAVPIDKDFAATQMVDNLRAMGCDALNAREILKLCELKIKKGDLHKQATVVYGASA